ncbi:Autophagy-related protein 16-1 [Orchesella cincta]|uniref:Autophagy-related protein 16-1 n=1 Tax=Orchesella cincta TaxID=48709 RepID=A0A1D2ND41_ORCCI|nr:Autophagy-related protein 16-1 [Orchesella cincta]
MRSQQWNGEFRNQILTLLRDRNKRESQGFTELFHHHEKLFENWAAIKAENLRLSVQVERGYSHHHHSSSYSEEREKVLEQKILSLQEELTELHRRRSENASHVLSLTAKLTDKEAELAAAQTQLATSVAKCADQDEQISFLQSKIQELEATNQLLRDEHQALHLAYTALEEKHHRLVGENKELVQRYMEIKAQHADFMNQENENFVKKRQAKVQKELEDAAKDSKAAVVLPESDTENAGLRSDISLLSTLAVGCVVPTIASHKFDSHENEVNAVRWSPNCKNFATGGSDRKVKLWETNGNEAELKAILTGCNGAILSVEFDSTGSLLLCTSSDFACRVWTVDDHRLRETVLILIIRNTVLFMYSRFKAGKI